MKKNRANVTNVDEGTSHSMFLSCHVAEEFNNRDIWLLDSGCSNHMTGNQDMFSILDDSVKSEIKLGDDHKVNALGKGEEKA